MSSEKNSCYTYFSIAGDFDPDFISDILGLFPERKWRVGDDRRMGGKYDFSSWEFGECSDYDGIVENQMLKTIEPLLSKVKELKEIKERCKEVYYTLEIVPSIYAGELSPCLAPSKEVIKFCYETDTEMDIDLYVYDSFDCY